MAEPRHDVPGGGMGLTPLQRDDPFITVIMPVRNEADFILESVGSVLTQSYPADRYEVLVVDGASDDGTLGLLAGLAQDHPGLRVLPNPGRTAPAALNVGLGQAAGDLVIRVDGHCTIEPDYLERCVAVHHETGAECVGGAIRTVGTTRRARSIAAAQSSRFGVGGVAFRTSDRAGEVDTLAFGAYRREVFDRIGTFDEELVRNQDDELNLRLTQAGGRIWMDPRIRSTYTSRAGFRGLWRQYQGYGTYKVRVMQKRRTVPSLRHLVPGAFVVGTLAAAALSALLRRPWPLLAVLGPYAALDVAASWQAADEARDVPAIATANTVMHVAYGTGFLRGLWRFRRAGAAPGSPGPRPSA